MARAIDIRPFASLPIGLRGFEMCERKGNGQPGTVIDSICEATSRDLSRQPCPRPDHTATRIRPAKTLAWI